MKAAIYPGSFDPMTLGHLDVIRRASKMFDTLIVSVLDNKAKNALFSVEERVSILKEATKDLPNVQVDSFQGLLIDYARQKDIHVSVHGIFTDASSDCSKNILLYNNSLFIQMCMLQIVCDTVYCFLTVFHKVSLTCPTAQCFNADTTTSRKQIYKNCAR